MDSLARVVVVDQDADEIRWTLPDVVAYQCRRCDLLVTVTVQGCALDDEPMLWCGRCWRRGKKRGALLPVEPPKSKNG